VKIESKKLEWTATARTTNLNTAYVPGGGDKKVREGEGEGLGRINPFFT
jgi:hypothetical protein